MKLYHRTTTKAAKAILAKGFRDARGRFGTDREWRGVWLSNVPLNDNDLSGTPVHLDALLLVTLRLSRTDLAFYEWVEVGPERRGYREWLIPAALVNRRGTVRLVRERSFSKTVSDNQ